eukprot:scaffold84718_cov15-Tisochrysis_lutea.AAC.1
MPLAASAAAPVAAAAAGATGPSRQTLTLRVERAPGGGCESDAQKTSLEAHQPCLPSAKVDNTFISPKQIHNHQGSHARGRSRHGVRLLLHPCPKTVFGTFLLQHPSVLAAAHLLLRLSIGLDQYYWDLSSCHLVALAVAWLLGLAWFWSWANAGARRDVA